LITSALGLSQTDRLLVTGRPCPAFRRAPLGLFVSSLTLGEEGRILTLRALDGGHEVDAPRAGLVVVTLHQRLHPETGLLQAGKALGGVVGAGLAGPQPRLGIRVIVAGPWAAIRGADPQPIQGLPSGLPLQGTAVVGRQDPGSVHARLGPCRPAHDLSGLDGRLALVDLPADALAAVAI
jgi:hypothetical protein